MSTYVVSMIEVRNGGKWELLRRFRRDDYLACEADGAFPKEITWKMSKEYLDEGEEPIEIGYIEDTAHFMEDYEIQDFLLNKEYNFGYIESDLGMPKDASPELVKKYNDYGPNASIPSYFYLVDLLGAYGEMKEHFLETVPRLMKADELKDINWKLDRLLQNIGFHIYDEEIVDDNFNEYVFKEKFNLLLRIYGEICRIRTLVEQQYGCLKATDIRITWFIY